MPTQSNIESQVLVVGGGPVGMFLTALLGKRGIETTTVERSLDVSSQAKIMAPSARTMEFCRQLGMADEGHTWGMPLDWPMNNVWVTSLDGYELSRVDSPPIGHPGAPGFSEHSPQFQVHCPQPWWEAIIERHARSYPSVEVRRGVEFVRFDEHPDHVVSTVRDLATGEVSEIVSQYLVSCEGVGSRAAQQLGIPVYEETIDYSYDVEFLCDDLLAEHDKGPAWRYTLIDESGTWGTIVAVDGKHRWRLSIYNLGREGATALQVEEKIVKAIGHDFEFTVIERGRWKRRTAIAASYGRGRVFIAGDAAHANPPNGGFGMNTGIADAANLAWKIQATLDGWGGPDLLASYGAERRPIAQITLAEAVRNYHRLVDETAFDDIAADTAAGAEHRRIVGEEKASESRQAWWPMGIHFGYGYPWSPIVVPDQGNYPAIELHDYVPSTDPGFRAPHVWLSEGVSTLDLFGPRHVLLRVGSSGATGDGLVAAAEAVSMPLDVHDIAGDEVQSVYNYRLVLVRPDGHVAWRGNDDPRDALQVINNIRGYAGTEVAPTRGASDELGTLETAPA